MPPTLQWTDPAQLPTVIFWSVQRIIGAGFFHVLWVVALLYCLSFGRQRERLVGQALLTALPLVVALPVLGLYLNRVFSPPYYPRYVWVLMVEILLACAGTELVRRQRGRWRRYMTLLAVIAMIGVCGQWIFTDRFYRRANPYKLLDATIAVADYVVREHPGETAYFPEEISVEIRQYEAAISMVSIRGTRWALEKALYPDQWQGKTQALLKRWNKVSVIVLKHVANHEHKLNQLGWHFEKRIGRYDIYTKTTGP